MSTPLLLAGLAAGSLQLILTSIAATNEAWRPWPPDELSGRFGLYWLLVMGLAGSFFAHVLTTAGSLYAIGPVSAAIGGGVFLAGAAVNVLTADAMDDPAEILGLEIRMHTDGLFERARHPEVVGHAGAVGGLALASGSWQAILLAGLAIVWFAIRPFVEEPVLAERFGDRYETYRAEVDRYLDI